CPVSLVRAALPGKDSLVLCCSLPAFGPASPDGRDSARGSRNSSSYLSSPIPHASTRMPAAPPEPAPIGCPRRRLPFLQVRPSAKCHVDQSKCDQDLPADAPHTAPDLRDRAQPCSNRRTTNDESP